MLFRSGGMSWGTPTPSGRSRRHPTHWGQGMDTTRQEMHSMEVTATSQQKERSNLSFLKVHVHVCLTIFSDLAHFSKWPNSIQTSHSLQIYISQSVILTVAISQKLPITACRHSLMWGNGYLHAWYTHVIVVLYFTLALTEPLYHGQLAKDYLQRTVNPTLIKGLTQLCKQKPEDPLVWASCEHNYIAFSIDNLF